MEQSPGSGLHPASKKYGVFTEQFPHPSVFIKTEIIKCLSPAFDHTYRIAADLKQQLLIANKLKVKPYHFTRTTSKISLGGRSTQNLFSYFEVGLRLDGLLMRCLDGVVKFFVLLKIARKSWELLKFKMGTILSKR